MKDVVLKSRTNHRAKRFAAWQIVLFCLAVVALAVVAGLLIQVWRAENERAAVQAQLQQNQLRINSLTAALDDIRQKGQLDLPTPATIRTSLVRFDHEFLTPTEEAQLAVIREVNQLSQQNGVIPSEISFDSIEQKALEGEEVGDEGARSLFPGMQMAFTVEGSYADIRKFLQSVERSRAFIVIETLDLKSVEAASGRARLNAGGSTDQVIALGVKLAVYYQRETS